jgi:hypothetical protein
MMSLATRLSSLFNYNSITSARALQFTLQRNKYTDNEPKHFLEYNDIMYPIQAPDEERRLAVSK